MLAMAASGCNLAAPVYIAQNPGNEPMLVHVFNGTKLGFYTETGGYGFGTQAASIFTLATTSIGTNQQMPVDSISGRFFLGTSICAGGCDELIYLDSYNGFRFGSTVTSSEYNLSPNGVSPGAALNQLLGTLYVSDSANDRVLIMNENNFGYQTGFSQPTLLSQAVAPTYLGSDNTLDVVVVTDPSVGAAFMMDGVKGDELSTSPFPLTLVGGGCAQASEVGFVAVSSINHLAYVLCAGSVTYLTTSSTLGTYSEGSLVASNFSLSNITTATDIAVNSLNNSILVSGSHYVDALDAESGALLTSMDLTKGNCGLSTMDLESLTYDSVDNAVFVADTQNNRIYELDAASLSFKNGSCSTSNFQTPDVTSPKRISFY